jgi:hypothetical protein
MGILDNFALPNNIESTGARQVIERMQFSDQDGVATMSGFDKSGVAYQFMMIEELNPIKSQEAGYEVYDEKEAVMFFKDRGTKPVELVMFIGGDRLTRNFKGEIVGGTMYEDYMRWKEGKQVQGYPLDRWDIPSRAEVRTLNSEAIYTVEQFASMPTDRVSQVFRGSQRYLELHERAKLYIGTKERRADIEAISSENEELKKRLDELEQASKKSKLVKAK